MSETPVYIVRRVRITYGNFGPYGEELRPRTFKSWRLARLYYLFVEFWSVTPFGYTECRIRVG